MFRLIQNNLRKYVQLTVVELLASISYNSLVKSVAMIQVVAMNI